MMGTDVTSIITRLHIWNWVRHIITGFTNQQYFIILQRDLSAVSHMTGTTMSVIKIGARVQVVLTGIYLHKGLTDLPNRLRAGSILFGRLVAAMMIT